MAPPPLEVYSGVGMGSASAGDWTLDYCLSAANHATRRLTGRLHRVAGVAKWLRGRVHCVTGVAKWLRGRVPCAAARPGAESRTRSVYWRRQVAERPHARYWRRPEAERPHAVLLASPGG